MPLPRQPQMNPYKLEELTEGQQAAVLDWLSTTYDEDIVGNPEWTEDIQIGIGIVLEALGRPDSVYA